MDRVRPVPDELTEPFWSAAREGRLEVQRCAGCGRYHHPPVKICPDCLATSLSFEQVSGRGTVLSYTVPHDSRHPYFLERTPFVIATVRLAEQDDLILLTTMPVEFADTISVGSPVEAVFEPGPDGFVLPQFRMTDEAAR